MIDVQPVISAVDLDAFVRFPHQLYRHDPYWIVPLHSEIRRRLDPARNPFWQHAERALFVARRDGEIVGTIAAIVNHGYNRQHHQRVGTFGFWETIDDAAVTRALIDRAIAWLRPHGVEWLRGPYNGAPTDEAGVLIAGFDRPPALWQGHAPPYYAALLESLGFCAYDDLLAYEIAAATLDRRAESLRRLARRLDDRAAVRVRSLREGDWQRDLATVHAIYNTAFRSIHEHADMRFETFAAQANGLRRVLDPDLALIVEVGDQPAGFAVALPELNQALRVLHGEPNPWRLARFEWRRRRIRTLCVKLLGVLPEIRGRGVEARLILELLERGVAKGYTHGEMSLVSARNQPMNRLLDRFGARVYRRYRVYERPIEPPT